MEWTRARDFTASVARLRRGALLDAALAARLAQAEAKDWKKWVAELGGV